MSNIEVGLSQFIDFSLKQGSSKVRIVRDVKNQPDYHPSRDFWKVLRQGIRDMHSNDLPLSYLEGLILKVNDKKRAHYVQAIKAYTSYFKRKDVSWFDPGKSYWAHDRLFVRSSPEIGLIINDEPHLIKLYFKEDSKTMVQRQTATILTLMRESTYGNEFAFTPHISMLNVKKKKLFTITSPPTPDSLLALQAEANYFGFLWDRI